MMLALFLAMKSMNNISSLHECDTSLADTGKRIAVKKKKKKNGISISRE